MPPKSSATERQRMDPKTGRPMIETLLSYAEPGPPKPKPKPKRLNHPLPWKQTASEKARLDTLRGEMADLEGAKSIRKDGYSINKKVNIPTRGSGAVSPRGGLAATGAELSDSPCKNMGTVKVLNTFTPGTNPRDLPPKAHFNSRVKPIGSAPRPKDGKKPPVPLLFTADEGEEERYDILQGKVISKPKTSEENKKKLDADQREERNVLGAAVVKPTPREDRQQSVVAYREDLARENDHYSKVMKRTKLVDMVNAEKDAAAVEAGKSYVDPTEKLDIFGRPMPKPANTTQGQSANMTKKKMFPGDQQPLHLFGNPTERKAPKAAEAHGLPSYISAPPAAAAPIVLDSAARGAAGGGPQFPGTSPKPGQSGAAHSLYNALYVSPLYKTIVMKGKGWGIRALRHALRDADVDNDSILSRHELKNAMAKFGFEFDENQINVLLSIAPAKCKPKATVPALKRTKAGEPQVEQRFVFIPVLMDVLRRDLSGKRKMVIDAAYQEACAMASKSVQHGITLDELEAVMSFNNHPSFQSHIRGSMREVMQAFGKAWGSRKARNAVISKEEFENFFHDVSASYHNDSEFVKMMKGMFSL